MLSVEKPRKSITIRLAEECVKRRYCGGRNRGKVINLQAAALINLAFLPPSSRQSTTHHVSIYSCALAGLLSSVSLVVSSSYLKQQDVTFADIRLAAQEALPDQRSRQQHHAEARAKATSHISHQSMATRLLQTRLRGRAGAVDPARTLADVQQSASLRSSSALGSGQGRHSQRAGAHTQGPQRHAFHRSSRS